MKKLKSSLHIVEMIVDIMVAKKEISQNKFVTGFAGANLTPERKGKIKGKP